MSQRTPVSCVMSASVITVTADMPLYDLICVLLDKNISGAPVVDREGRALGMVSQSDLISEDHDWAEGRRLAHTSWKRIAGPRTAQDAELFEERNLSGRTVADVMTSHAVSVLVTASIAEAAKLMVQHRVHRLSVVDTAKRVIGIITTFDITRWVAAVVRL